MPNAYSFRYLGRLFAPQKAYIKLPRSAVAAFSGGVPATKCEHQWWMTWWIPVPTCWHTCTCGYCYGIQGAPLSAGPGAWQVRCGRAASTRDWTAQTDGNQVGVLVPSPHNFCASPLSKVRDIPKMAASTCTLCGLLKGFLVIASALCEPYDPNPRSFQIPTKPPACHMASNSNCSTILLMNPN